MSRLMAQELRVFPQGHGAGQGVISRDHPTQGREPKLGAEHAHMPEGCRLARRSPTPPLAPSLHQGCSLGRLFRRVKPDGNTVPYTTPGPRTEAITSLPVSDTEIGLPVHGSKLQLNTVLCHGFHWPGALLLLSKILKKDKGKFQDGSGSATYGGRIPSGAGRDQPETAQEGIHPTLRNAP